MSSSSAPLASSFLYLTLRYLANSFDLEQLSFSVGDCTIGLTEI